MQEFLRKVRVERATEAAVALEKTLALLPVNWSTRDIEWYASHARGLDASIKAALMQLSGQAEEVREVEESLREASGDG